MQSPTSPQTNRNKPDQHHVSLFYESQEERLRFLAEYLRIGLERDELCVVISHQPADQLIAGLLSAGLDVRKCIKQGNVRLFHSPRTHLSSNRIVLEYMLNNVANFMADASAQGYTGFRAAGEMDWPNSQAPGLCFYPISAASMAAIKADEQSTWLEGIPYMTLAEDLSPASIKKLLLGAGKA